MDAHFYESPSDKTKKKKGAGKEQNLHLFNGGALLMQADEGESSINFFMRVLRTFADWKYELSKDEIEIRLLTAGVETLQLKEVLPNISQYVNKWTSIYNEEVTRIIKLLLTWVKPSVGTHSYSLYFSMAVESLAYKNKTNKIITTFDAFYNSYTRQESEEEYDKFFSCFKFGMDDKNERAYFELLKIYFAGIVYNMFAPELRLALKDNKYRPKHIHEDKWEEILKEVNNEFPMFSGMIIICGEQGLGKSYLINSILPDTLRDGLRIGSDLIPSTDEIKFSIAKKIRGCFIMNLEDISMPYIKRLPTFIKNSSSINGIHIFMQYSVEMEKDILDSSNIKARFGQYYNVFAQQMAGALSAYRGVIQIDSACKDLPRLCVMNYPFCSYYNEDALEINYVLPNEPPAPTPALRQRQWTPARDAIEKRIYAAEGVSNLAEYIMKVANISDCHDKGNEIVMTCPFKEHNDTKPSFFVNKHNNVYYCHGNCGALYPQGGLLKFLQAYYNLVRIQDVGAYIRKEYNT